MPKFEFDFAVRLRASMSYISQDKYKSERRLELRIIKFVRGNDDITDEEKAHMISYRRNCLAGLRIGRAAKIAGKPAWQMLKEIKNQK